MNREAAYWIIRNVIANRRIRRAHIAATTGKRTSGVTPAYINRIAVLVGRYK